MLAFFNHIGEIFKKDNSACEQRIDNFPVLDCLNIQIYKYKVCGGLHYKPRETFLCLFGVQKKVS